MLGVKLPKIESGSSRSPKVGCACVAMKSKNGWRVTSDFVFKIKQRVFLDTVILKTLFLVVYVHTFRADVTNISANTKPLVTTKRENNWFVGWLDND